jgi:hypothetical protein
MGDYEDMMLAERILRDDWRIRSLDGFRLVELHEVTSVVLEARYGGMEGVANEWCVPPSEVLRAGHPDAVRRVAAAHLLGAPVASAGDREGHVAALPSSLRARIEKAIARWKRESPAVDGATVSVLRERVARCKIGTLSDDVFIALDSERVIGWRKRADESPPEPVRSFSARLSLGLTLLVMGAMAPVFASGLPLHVVGAFVGFWSVVALLVMLGVRRIQRSPRASRASRASRSRRSRSVPT